MLVEVGVLEDGALACRTLISQVSRSCETENCFGSFEIRALSASFTLLRKAVVYSCGAITHRGGVRG